MRVGDRIEVTEPLLYNALTSRTGTVKRATKGSEIGHWVIQLDNTDTFFAVYEREIELLPIEDTPELEDLKR